MLASIRRFAADVVKHAILGEAADPSGDVQNVSLGRAVGVSDDCLVVVGHLRLPPRDCFVDGSSLFAFIVLLISLSPSLVDSSCETIDKEAPGGQCRVFGLAHTFGNT